MRFEWGYYGISISKEGEGLQSLLLRTRAANFVTPHPLPFRVYQSYGKKGLEKGKVYSFISSERACSRVPVDATNKNASCYPGGSLEGKVAAAVMADEEEDPPFEEDTEEAGGGPDGAQGKRKRLFSKELRCMMYGFGDDQNPYTESVDILEDLVIEFITEMVGLACLLVYYKLGEADAVRYELCFWCCCLLLENQRAEP
ncbi:transcription initiation factor TFIID subunit 13 [Podarcis lilfordi]|uniref:Transcription initiation factor TFIID subunit 13 n=1 Tax=Podarcis lilfordi TaxID=74358 RepID=A0AA35K9G5_9SAUR|nr:transcription initiation factor TFIID subunit 13 [Podarcis lilfordi]